jgi:NADPH:quinone reductase-like Zn-dependent oxidoreductase
MAKVIRGRAGRMEKKATILDTYGTTLAQMLLNQVRPRPTDRVLHLGSAGAVRVAEQLAERLAEGEMVVLVHTYDELEDTRAALAGFGNVHVINEADDLDPDEPPFPIVTCIAPYNLGRDAVRDLIAYGVGQLAPQGTFYLAGDKQQEMARYEEMLSGYARTTQVLANNGQYRVVSMQASDLRRGKLKLGN